VSNGKLEAICFRQGTDRNRILGVQSDKTVIKYEAFIMSIVGLYAAKNSRDNNPEPRVIQRWLPNILQLIQICHQLCLLKHNHTQDNRLSQKEQQHADQGNGWFPVLNSEASYDSTNDPRTSNCCTAINTFSF